MRRLSWLDLALLVGLLPLWLLASALHTARSLEDRSGWLPLHVEAPAAPDAYPTVRGLIAGAPAGAYDIRPGDRVLRAGDRDLRGVGPLRFAMIAYAEADAEFRLPLELERAGVVRSAAVPFQRVLFPLRTLAPVLATGAMAFLVLLRGRGRREVRAWFLAGVVYSLNWSLCFGPREWQTALWLALAFSTTGLLFPLALRALLFLPRDLAPRSRLGPAWPFVFAPTGLALTSWQLGWPLSSEHGFVALLGANVAFALLGLALLVRSYRRADAGGRRQLKWVAYGIWVGLLPVGLGAAVAAWDPALLWVYDLSTSAAVLIPVCFAIAIVRDDFLDIDRLITETASYSAVSVLLLAGLFGLVPPAARAISAGTGLDPGFAQALAFLAVAGVVVPTRRALHPWFERIFYGSRRALERDLVRLRDELGLASDPGKLLERAGERLDALLGPESCVVYARTGAVFEPVFARGASVPPAFAAGGTLASLLLEHAAPADRARWRRWLRGGALDAPTRAALETLAPEVILPIAGDDELLAFVCLGARRSGDLHTASELAWLAALADRAARVLLRFGDVELLERANELGRKLERYVPGPIARRLQRGLDVEPREREVSVLFVDVRGYTSLAAARGAEEIFSIVSRYTEAVSRVVLEHGGSVVEFHGDGMMVVFGAPDPLERKEEAAVRAALAVTRAVPQLSPADAALSVGVGVATGPAFVGNIRSADRVIWGAIGNTTNLAARLQSLTRELDAAVAIDEATHAGAGAFARGFRLHPRVGIRGRPDPVDVWALAREAHPGLRPEAGVQRMP